MNRLCTICMGVVDNRTSRKGKRRGRLWLHDVCEPEYVRLKAYEAKEQAERTARIRKRLTGEWTDWGAFAWRTGP